MINYLVHYKDGREISGKVTSLEDVEKLLDVDVSWITAAAKDFSHAWSWEWKVLDEEFVSERTSIIEDNVCSLF